MKTTRCSFLKAATVASVATVAAPFNILHADEAPVLGQGDFRYRVVPDWGLLGAETPVNNCHGLVRDREGHIILLTDHVKNNVIRARRENRAPICGMANTRDEKNPTLLIATSDQQHILRLALDGK